VKPKGKPRGPWANKTPEERAAYSRQLAAQKKGPSGGRRPGVPASLTVAQYEALVAEQTPIVNRIIKKMAANGELPEDPDVIEAFRETMVILRTQPEAKNKLAAARLILDFKKAKPTSKVEHTIKTAEDYLDELIEEDSK
jgi:hypothetical protein